MTNSKSTDALDSIVKVEAEVQVVLPDVRDGLNRRERAVLYCLNELQKERGGSNVPTPMLYGRVVELEDMSVGEMQSILQRLIGNDW